jgi:NifU-like protein involved in Fe-S cluster formation
MVEAARPAAAKLYTPNLLALATGLAAFPLHGPFQLQSTARSRACGSIVEVGVDCDEGGRIARIGLTVTACAVGQSAATIMARGAAGRSAPDMAAARARIEQWLAGTGPLPDWPGFAALEPALPHAGRHGALLLPWKAVDQALSSAPPAR